MTPSLILLFAPLTAPLTRRFSCTVCSCVRARLALTNVCVQTRRTASKKLIRLIDVRFGAGPANVVLPATGVVFGYVFCYARVGNCESGVNDRAYGYDPDAHVSSLEIFGDCIDNLIRPASSEATLRYAVSVIMTSASRVRVENAVVSPALLKQGADV